MPNPSNRRILIVDDNASLHEDFRRILNPDNTTDDIDSAAAALFGGDEPAEPSATTDFELTFAFQGDEALRLVQAAHAADNPFALAFVDMRMPPGWDGLTTILKLWEVDPDLHVVICTAYTDRSWTEIQTKLVARDRWLVLKKPFDKIEVLQMAQALCEKWNLARKVAGNIASLEQAISLRTEQLRQSIQVKNEFLANVSHELMTPMNGIIGMLDLLSDLDLDETQRGCLQPARECSAVLLDLLRQILAFNQAEAGTLALESVPFRLADLASQGLETFRERAAHKGLVLQNFVDDPDLSETIHAPASVIQIILRALLDNAIKFTDTGGVSLSANQSGRHVVINLRDTGRGLTEDQLVRVSLPFAQVDGGMTRKNSGIGLGLPLARRLTDSLGGEFSLTPHPAGGTVASFSFLRAAQK